MSFHRQTGYYMGSLKIHFDDTGLVNFLCHKFVSDFCVSNAEVAERLFAASQISNNAEDVNHELHKLVTPFRHAIIQPLPNENKINIFILIIV